MTFITERSPLTVCRVIFIWVARFGGLTNEKRLIQSGIHVLDKAFALHGRLFLHLCVFPPFTFSLVFPPSSGSLFSLFPLSGLPLSTRSSSCGSNVVHASLLASRQYNPVQILYIYICSLNNTSLACRSFSFFSFSDHISSISHLPHITRSTSTEDWIVRRHAGRRIF